MHQVSELRHNVHLTETTSRGKILHNVFKVIKAIPRAPAQDVRAERGSWKVRQNRVPQARRREQDADSETQTRR